MVEPIEMKQKEVHWMNTGPTVTSNFDLTPMRFTLDLPQSNFEIAISQEYEDLEQKGCESIACWTHHVNLKYDLDRLDVKCQIFK